MRFARIAVLAIALLAGVTAAVLVSGGDDAPPPPQVVEKAPTSEVLVANVDIPMGQVITSDALAWRSWPESGTDGFITKSGQPDALDDVAGAIARQPIASGEPIRAQKIVKADGSGFMAAILPQGMRAVATEISAETGAGGFILPNDRVDVILTRRDDSGASGEKFSSETILSNVRILAIDQQVSEKDGEKVVIGRTATLELMPRQAEILALARSLGTISLALRALVDSTGALAGGGPEERFGKSVGGMTVIRYGQASSSIER